MFRVRDNSVQYSYQLTPSNTRSRHYPGCFPPSAVGCASMEAHGNSDADEQQRSEWRQFEMVIVRFGSQGSAFPGLADQALHKSAVFGGTQVDFHRPQLAAACKQSAKSLRCGINLDALLCETLSLHRVELQTVRRIVFVNIPHVVHGSRDRCVLTR